MDIILFYIVFMKPGTVSWGENVGSTLGLKCFLPAHIANLLVLLLALSFHCKIIG